VWDDLHHKALSFQSDRLHAFRGIMNMFTTQDDGKISQVGGIRYYSKTGDDSELRETFTRNLLWEHVDDSSSSNRLLRENHRNQGPPDVEPLPS